MLWLVAYTCVAFAQTTPLEPGATDASTPAESPTAHQWGILSAGVEFEPYQRDSDHVTSGTGAVAAYMWQPGGKTGCFEGGLSLGIRKVPVEDPKTGYNETGVQTISTAFRLGCEAWLKVLVVQLYGEAGGQFGLGPLSAEIDPKGPDYVGYAKLGGGLGIRIQDWSIVPNVGLSEGFFSSISVAYRQ